MFFLFFSNTHTHILLEFAEFSRSVLHDGVPWSYRCIHVFTVTFVTQVFPQVYIYMYVFPLVSCLHLSMCSMSISAWSDKCFIRSLFQERTHMQHNQIFSFNTPNPLCLFLFTTVYSNIIRRITQQNPHILGLLKLSFAWINLHFLCPLPRWESDGGRWIYMWPFPLPPASLWGPQ